MKNKIFIKSLILPLLLSLVMFSCKKEDKEYSSISGQWECEENSNNSIKVYTIDVEQSSVDNNKYAIYNFNNAGVEERIFPTVRNDTLFIETQFIGSTTISVQGLGFISKDKKIMRLEYTISNDVTISDILSVCTHQ